MPLHFYLIEAEMTQQNAQSTSEPTISENDLIAQRHAKLKQIQDVAKETGKSPWPNTFKREHYAADLQEQFKDQSKEQIESAEHVYVKVAGRVMLNRIGAIVSSGLRKLSCCRSRSCVAIFRL